MVDDLLAIVLATEVGKCLESGRAAFLHHIAGRSVLDHTLHATEAYAPRRTLLLTDVPLDVLEPHPEIDIICADETAAPEQQVQDLRDRTSASAVLIVAGALPLLRTSTLDALFAAHREGNAELTRTSGELCVAQNGPILWEVLTSIFAGGCATPEDLERRYLNEGRRVAIASVGEPQEVVPVATLASLAKAATVLHQRKAVALMKAGVVLLDPANTYIDAGVAVGRGTEILPGVYLRGRTTIGEECQVGPNTWIEDSVIGTGCRIRFASLERATVRDASTVGPYTHLRPDADVGPGARIGNFVEIKASRVGRGTKVGHHTYLGDADVGAETNIGAGTITCNYDGKRKHRTTIGERAFIGSNVSLIAPIVIGADAYVAAGSTITEDVPPGGLAFGRAHQVNRNRGNAIEEGTQG